MSTSIADASANIPADERLGEKATEAGHPLRRRSVWLPIVVVLFILNIPFLHLWLRGSAKTTTTIPFSDDFNREELGPNWFSPSGGFWRIVDGWVLAPGTPNNALWLRAALPANVAIEFDVRADTADGDVKCEIFGDGRSHSTGYILIFGGWKNTRSIIARRYEHGPDITNMSGPRREQAMEEEKWVVSRPLSSSEKVERGRVYHWRIVRDGKTLTWYVDGQLYLQLDDPHPLSGPGHDRFAFSSWATDAYYKNLVIQPLR